MLKSKKILITGGAGFLGSHIVDVLLKKERVPKENIFVFRSSEYDLRKREDVEKLFENFSPDIVIHLATNARGIEYNKTHPGTLYYDNVIMNSIVMDVSRQKKVETFVAVGTALAYPSEAEIPLKESDIWKGYPDEALASLGLASRMMMAQSQAYKKEFGFKVINIIPANLYGPRDHFSSEHAHVIPSIINKIYNASKNDGKIELFGTGSASREFLYVEDAAETILEAIKKYDKPDPLNLGSGIEITIKELVEKIANLMKFNGEILWNKSKAEGQKRRCLDSTRIMKELGFISKTGIDEGLKKTVEWFLNNKDKLSMS